MNALEIIKKLNKERIEGNLIKPFSELTEGERKGTYTTTGSFLIDYKLNKGLGIKDGLFYLVVGGEGSGKTSFVLSVAAQEIKKSGKYVVFFDAEGTTDASYITRSGIDEDKFIRIRSACLEDMLNDAESFSKADDVGMIIIDSIPAFYSKTVELKNAEDNHISIEAKKFNTRMPIVIGHCIPSNIKFFAITYYKLNPGVIGGDPRVLPRGEWQKYNSSGTFELKRESFLFDLEGIVIGQKIKVKIKKSKLGIFNPKGDFEVDYYFDSGFDNISDKVKILVEEGVIEKSSSWFLIPSGEKFQGIDKTASFFRDNEDYLNTLIDGLQAKL